MEIVWLLGTILVIGGATFLFLKFFDKPRSKKHRRKHIRTKSSNFAVIDDGEAHIAPHDRDHPVGDHGCDE